MKSLYSIVKFVKLSNVTVIAQIKMSTSCFEGVPLEKVYRGQSQWDLDHLPPIDNKRNHIVLFQLPISINSTQPPAPHKADIKWDQNHVKLPSALQNLYKTESSVIKERDIFFEKRKKFIAQNLRLFHYFCRTIQRKKSRQRDGKSFKQHYFVIFDQAKNWNGQF